MFPRSQFLTPKTRTLHLRGAIDDVDDDDDGSDDSDDGDVLT